MTDQLTQISFRRDIADSLVVPRASLRHVLQPNQVPSLAQARGEEMTNRLGSQNLQMTDTKQVDASPSLPKAEDVLARLCWDFESPAVYFHVRRLGFVSAAVYLVLLSSSLTTSILFKEQITAPSTDQGVNPLF